MNHIWTKREVELVKGLWADEGGRQALEMIIERLGNLAGPSFVADPHMTAFNEGRRFVARELAAAINLPVEQLIAEEPHGRPRVITATERAERAAAGQYNPITGRRPR